MCRDMQKLYRRTAPHRTAPSVTRAVILPILFLLLYVVALFAVLSAVL